MEAKELQHGGGGRVAEESTGVNGALHLVTEHSFLFPTINLWLGTASSRELLEVSFDSNSTMRTCGEPHIISAIRKNMKSIFSTKVQALTIQPFEKSDDGTMASHDKPSLNPNGWPSFYPQPKKGLCRPNDIFEVSHIELPVTPNRFFKSQT